jgi:hypothetical protein
VKEISLQDLLNLADATAHDGICDFWNQKTIHYLVVFTSSQEDFELIGVGPTLPCASLEDAERHVIPGKKPEFYVKCPAAVAKRLQPKLAPSLKGSTSTPFTRLEPKAALPPSIAHPEAIASAPPPPTVSVTPAITPSSHPVPESTLPASAPSTPATSTQPEIQSPKPEAASAPKMVRLTDFDVREAALAECERALAEREQHAHSMLDQAERKKTELAELETQLKKRETALAEREALVTAGERRLTEQFNHLLEKQQALTRQIEEHEKTRGPRASSDPAPGLKPIVA